MRGWLRRRPRAEVVEEVPDPLLVAWAEGMFTAERAHARSRGAETPATEQFAVPAPVVPEPSTDPTPSYDVAEHRRRNGPFMPLNAVCPPPPMPGGA